MTAVDLPSIDIDFLLSSTTALQRGQMLITCATNNDITGLQKLITAEPAVVKRSGEDAFAAACGKGHLDAAKRLHALGVKVDGFLFDDSNPAVTIAQYPLHCAFENSQWDVAQWLLDHGAKVMHMSRVLGNMVNKTPALFRQMLKDVAYIKSYETPEATRTTLDEKIHADALGGALETIAYNDYTAYSAIALEEGLSPRSLYDVAMKKHAYAILRDLYVMGYRPDVDQMNAHVALMDGETREVERAERVRELVQAWVHADNHLLLDSQTLQNCRAQLSQGFDVGVDVPAALVLARGGEFSRDVAPLLPQAGIDLLLLKDCHGATLIDTLVVRGELLQVFDPAIWRGNFAQAVALHGQLPDNIQARIDLTAVSASFGRYRMGSGNARFKLPHQGKGG